MSKLQLFSVMSTGTLVYVYTYALNSLMASTGTNGWMSAIIGCVVWIALFIPAVMLIRKSGKKTLAALIYDCLGEFFGMVVNCLVVAAVILSMSERLYECIRLMHLYGYSKTPAAVIAAVIAIVAFYCGKAGHTAVAKAAVPVVIALLAGIIIVILSGTGMYEFGNLFPILGYGAASTAKGSIWILSAVDNTLVGLIICDQISDKKLSGGCIAASITAAAAYALSAYFYRMAFPYAAGAENTSGIIDIARGTESGGFFQRFEAMLLFIVITGMIMFIAVYLSAAVKQVDDTFSFKKKRSWLLAAIIAAIVFTISLIPDRTKITGSNLLQWYRQYSFFFVLAVAIAMLIGGLIKRGFAKRAATTAVVLALCMSLCSCGDYREIENEAYAVMIGIDNVSTEAGYSYSLRLMGEQSEVITIVAPSLNSAIKQYTGEGSRDLSLKNLRMLAVSYDVAKSGILKHIDPIVLDTNTKNSIMLAVCNGSAEQFISSERFGNTQEIELVVSERLHSDLYDPISVSKIHNGIYSTIKDAYASYVSEITDKGCIINGSVYFSGDKAVGVLDGDETAMIKAAFGRMAGYELTSDEREFEISSKRPCKIGVNSGKIYVTVYLKCTENGKSVDIVPEKVTHLLSDRLEAALSDAQSAGSDILGIGGAVAKQHATIGGFENSNWKCRYRTAQINVNVVF